MRPSTGAPAAEPPDPGPVVSEAEAAPFPLRFFFPNTETLRENGPLARGNIGTRSGRDQGSRGPGPRLSQRPAPNPPRPAVKGLASRTPPRVALLLPPLRTGGPRPRRALRRTSGGAS